MVTSSPLLTVVGVIVRSPRTKRAGDGGTDGFDVGVGEGVVDCCTADGVTGFAGNTTGVDGAGESGTVDGAGAAVGLFVAIGVWQPKPFTSKTTTMSRPSRIQVGFLVT